MKSAKQHAEKFVPVLVALSNDIDPATMARIQEMLEKEFAEATNSAIEEVQVTILENTSPSTATVNELLRPIRNKISS